MMTKPILCATVLSVGLLLNVGVDRTYGQQCPVASEAAILNSDAADDVGGALGDVDERVELATDGAGVWIAVWNSQADPDMLIGNDEDIMFSRSLDNGATWSDQTPLNTNAATDLGLDTRPQIATDGAGNWVVVWISSEDLGGTGTDKEVLVATSANNGVTWSDPAVMNGNAALDTSGDEEPRIVTDGAGTWITIWRSADTIDGSGFDRDILSAVSVNNGLTWSFPILLNSSGLVDAGEDRTPDLTTDGLGTWIAVWRSNDFFLDTIGTDLDILYAVSIDNGTSWSATAVLNSEATVDAREADDRSPRITTDGAGIWVTVWDSEHNLGGTVGTDHDVMFAVSANDGLSWTPQAILNTSAVGDFGLDRNCEIETDGLGNWVAVWWSNDDFGGTVNVDRDVFISISTDDAVTWSDPSILNSNAQFDTGEDDEPKLVSDGAGNWIAVWQTTNSFGGTIGIDPDMAYGTFIITQDDCNFNGIPDECEIDCNDTGIPDDCDIANGDSDDLNENGIPDECEPLVTQQPVGDTICEGESASMSVSAIGTEPLRYQWELEGVEIFEETDSTINIVNATDADEGDYTCVVTNDFGSTESDPATLTVMTDNDCAAQDGQFCNGPETCGTAGICDPDPVGDPCPGQFCDEINDQCGIGPGTHPAISIELTEINGADVIGAPASSFTVAPGNVLTAEFFVRDWSPFSQGLRGYEIMIDSSGFTSGTSGSIFPKDWATTTDINNCSGGGPSGLPNDSNAFMDVATCFENESFPPGEPDPVGSDLGPWGITNPCAPTDCETGEQCQSPSIDWIHGGISAANTNVFVDSNDCDYRYGEILNGGIEAPVSGQDGSKFYLGTLVLEISELADGVFTICLDNTDDFAPFGDPENTFLRDENNDPIVPLLTECLVLTVDACKNDADCDDNNVCNGLEFCDLDAGICKPGTPLVCDDGVFCNGLEICDQFAGCNDDEDPCPIPGFALCDEINERCVNCLSNEDCPEGEGCDTQVGECEPAPIILLLESSTPTPAPGSIFEVAVFLDNQSVSAIEVSAYQAIVECSASGGVAGTVDAETSAGGEACTGYASESVCDFLCLFPVLCLPGESELECPGGEACLGADGQPVPPPPPLIPGLCEGLGTCSTVPAVDELFFNYVLSCSGFTVSLPDFSCAEDGTINVNAADFGGAGCPVEIGERKYLGTFFFRPSADAEGDFQIKLADGSLILNEELNPLTFITQNVIVTPGAQPCEINVDCEDGEDCTSDLCNLANGQCDFPPRLFGDINVDGLANIVDVVCLARAAFQGLTECQGIEIDLDFDLGTVELDLAPVATCGDGLLNIVDVIVAARAAFQNLNDDCCNP